MNYISEIFERMDLQQIREFLLNGQETNKIKKGSYKERLDSAEKAVFSLIETKYPDLDEFDKIANKIYQFVSETQEVYMEIGLQCGGYLVAQLLTGQQKG